MKIKIDTQKSAEAVSSFLQKTSDLGKKAVADVQASAVALSEKTKQDSYLRKLKKYNPLFPDLFYSSEFNLPNMIMIRDDAERRGIDVCEGAIGWLGNEGGMEVLYLYDEAVASSGIRFVPSADCNAIYYVDKFDRKKFIRTDCIFKNAHNERIAELEHVAYSLGASHCVIDIVEKEKTSQKANKRVNFNKKANMQLQDGLGQIDSETSSRLDRNSELTYLREDKRRCESTWEGSNCPKRPKLKWFSYDDGIKGLIEMRCRGGNTVKTKCLEFYGSDSATMSKDTACHIDSAISSIGSLDGKKGNKGYSEFEKQVTRETEQIFIFNVEF